MKLAIIVGTRPEIIRLSSTIKLAKRIFDTTIIHTGQNYDRNLSDVFFDDLEIPTPDFYLNCGGDDNNLGNTVGNIISKSYDLLSELKPDAVLILGDTNSCLCAYSAKRLKIPIFHLEAGNRAFDVNVPEEINRKIIDHISDINICYTEHSKQNLLLEGIDSKYLFVSGSPIPEIVEFVESKVESSDVLERLNLEEYVIVSAHREDNIDNINNFLSIVDIIKKLSRTYKVVFSKHPRTNKQLKKFNIRFNDNVIESEPFGIIDYYKLQKKAICVISDSGTVTEEASVLKFKAILLRSSTEHPEGVDSGNVLIAGICDEIDQMLDFVLGTSIINDVDDYSDNNFSEKVCKIIMGYTSIINKFVWLK